jgi:hypothetical protein
VAQGVEYQVQSPELQKKKKIEDSIISDLNFLNNECDL